MTAAEPPPSEEPAAHADPAPSPAAALPPASGARQDGTLTTVTVEFTDAQIASYWMECNPINTVAQARRRRQARTGLFIALALSAAVPIIALTGASTFRPNDDRLMIMSLVLMTAIAAWLSFFSALRPILSSTRRRAAAQYVKRVRRSPTFREHVRYTLTPDGLAAHTSDSTGLWLWRDLKDIRATPSFLELVFPNDFVAVVPRASFESENTGDHFYTSARALHNASGYGLDDRIIAHLLANDIPCPGCGYNLRGVITRRCPECSYNIDDSILTRDGPSPRRRATE